MKHNKMHDTQGIVPFALMMGVPQHSDPRKNLQEFADRLRKHPDHEWCLWRSCGTNAQAAYKTAYNLRAIKKYKDIDWASQRYINSDGGHAWRVIARLKNKKGNKMKTVNPINIEVASLSKGWATSAKSKGVEFMPDALVEANSVPAKRSRNYELVDAAAGNVGKWVVFYRNANNGYCHTRKYQLTKRFGKCVDGSPYMEFRTVKNGDMYCVVGRLPIDNAL